MALDAEVAAHKSHDPVVDWCTTRGGAGGADGEVTESGCVGCTPSLGLRTRVGVASRQNSGRKYHQFFDALVHMATVFQLGSATVEDRTRLLP